MRNIALIAPAALGAVVLGACSAATKPAPAASTEAPAPVASDADQCGAGKLGAFIGKTPSDETIAAIRALAAPERIRVIRPGQAVTMDYRPDRLNIDVGEDGLIKRFHCV